MKTILWLSRHHMGDDQLEDLKSSLNDDIEVITKNITWAASGDSSADIATNRMIWAGLLTEVTNYPHIVIAGVFPPVAMESLSSLRVSDDNFGYSKCVFTPISSVMRVTLDGKTIKRLVFHRWMEV